MFLSFGINRTVLQNDLDFAYTLFKEIIVGLGTGKISAYENIEHNFLPPPEMEKFRKQEEAKLNSKSNNCYIKTFPIPKALHKRMSNTPTVTTTPTPGSSISSIFFAKRQYFHNIYGRRLKKHFEKCFI